MNTEGWDGQGDDCQLPNEKGKGGTNEYDDTGQRGKKEGMSKRGTKRRTQGAEREKS